MNLLNLAQQQGLNPKWFAGTGGDEYATFCPECGGNDRFRIWPNKKMKNCIGSYWCRKCNIAGDSIQFCINYHCRSFKAAIQCVGASMPDRVMSVLYENKNTFKPSNIEQLPNKWIACANNFTQECHHQIWQYPDVLNSLKHRGLTEDVIKQFKIGYNATDLYQDRIEWGLDSEDVKSKVWLPAGIVIPTLDTKANVIRIKVRRNNWMVNDKLPKYVAIAGSQKGLNIVGKTNNKNIMVVVESEFDAIVVAHLISEFGFAISVGSSLKNTDTLTHYLAKKVEHLLICHDNDQAGLKMLDKWQKLYTHSKAHPTPVGKDIGEAIEMGFDVRNWILGVLPKQNNAITNFVEPIPDALVSSGLEVVVNKVEDVLQAAQEVSLTTEQPAEIMDPITGEIFESTSEFISISNTKPIGTCHCNPFKIVEGKCSCSLKNAPGILCDVCSKKYCNCVECKESHLVKLIK